MTSFWQKVAASIVLVIFGGVSLANGCLTCSDLVPQGTAKTHCCNPKGHCDKPGSQQSETHKDCTAKPADLAKIESVVSIALDWHPTAAVNSGSFVIAPESTALAAALSQALLPDDPLHSFSQLRL